MIPKFSSMMEHQRFLAIFGIIFMLLESSSCHLDEPCNFNMCLNSIILPIKHAYCDIDNRCKCEQGFVAVNPHRCAEIQYPGKPCEHDNVCRFRDENSYCDKNRMHPICECKKSHIYDSIQRKCIPYVKKSKKSTPLFPITAIIMIACIGIFCGCGIICHNFRRQPELSAGERRHRSNIGGGGGGATSSRTAEHRTTNLSTGLHHPSLVRSDSRSSSSKYDSSLYDDPPPRYEDAVKEYPEVILDLEPLITTGTATATTNTSSVAVADTALTTTTTTTIVAPKA